MSTFNDNGIHFDNVKNMGVKLATGPVLINGLIGTDPDDGTGIINAIDIDWNNANLKTAVTNLSNDIKEDLAVDNINTTGDLLKVIAQLQAQVNLLTNLVKGLYTSLTNP